MIDDGHTNEYTDVDVARKALERKRVMADYLAAGRALGAMMFGVTVPECDDETIALRAAGVRNMEEVAYGVWADGDLIGVVYASGRRVMCAHRAGDLKEERS